MVDQSDDEAVTPDAKTRAWLNFIGTTTGRRLTNKNERHQQGRYDGYDPEKKKILIDYALECVTTGMTLTKICESNPALPDRAVLIGWLNSPEVVDRYNTAKKLSTDAHLDNAADISDDVDADPNAVAKARLQVSTRFQRVTINENKYSKLQDKETLKAMTPDELKELDKQIKALMEEFVSDEK